MKFMSLFSFTFIVFVLIWISDVNTQGNQCQTGLYGNIPWIICDKRTFGEWDELWVHHYTTYGTYNMLSVCQSLGYTSVYQRRGTSGHICGYTSGYSCSSPQPWNTMWPQNSLIWTGLDTSCCSIAWVCRRPKVCLGPALRCNQVLTTVSVWGLTMTGIDFTTTGYATLGEYTLLHLNTLSTSIDITCNDNPDGITISSTSTMRALMGSYTSNSQFPTSYSSCGSQANPNEVLNSPHDPASAQQLCRQLGYRNGTVIAENNNGCPEAHYNVTTQKWESDYVRSLDWGSSFTCFGSCPIKYVYLIYFLIYAIHI